MSSQGTGGTGSSTNPLSKMEYNTNVADVKAFEDMYNANESLFTMSNRPDTDKDTSRDCTTSSPVDFLYLSTIRGGRKMNGGCGCGMKGGSSGFSSFSSFSSFSGGCGCGMKGGMSDGSEGEYSGGCFTCKKGAKKITHIYSSIHIIIPKLYSKYSNKKTKKAAKPAKPTKPTKAIIKKTKY
jgi:hypothetical protein